MQLSTFCNSISSGPDIVSRTSNFLKAPIPVSAGMPAFRTRPIMFSIRPTHCVRKVARPQYQYGIGHVAARSKRTRRNVALYSCAQRHVLWTERILSLVGARSIEASACLSFGTTGTTPWSRWRRLPLSSSLSWWLPALFRWRKVGGDKRVRQKSSAFGTSRLDAMRTAASGNF